MDDLATSEHDCNAHLVSLLQEFQYALELSLKIMFPRFRSELNLFHRGGSLVLLTFVLTLFLLEFITSVVHDAANGWIRIRRDFHQVQTDDRSSLPGLFDRQDSELFPIFTDGTNETGPCYLIVDTQDLGNLRPPSSEFY